MDKYASPTTSNTRRAKQSLIKSQNPLQVYAPNVPEPKDLDELYGSTLPQVRSQLRQKGLRQVGILKSISEEEFHRNKYLSNKAHLEHDPYNPIAYTDPSLRAFAPSQWTAEKPPKAEDDVVRQAVQQLETSFHITPKTIKQGDLISYTFIAKTASEYPLELQLSISVVHPASSRVISLAERKVRIAGGS